ncbi:N-acetylglucosamine-6-phosphate deacetylase [Kwoniella mangroviensis CBS 8886]|nr:N-acetylglucosamine-6-phosphate deacetylase [Kwoniella mangroviensis CBS 8886]
MTSERYIQLTNIHLILPSGALSALTSLYIDTNTGLICSPPSSSSGVDEILTIDLKGHWVSPGMIDIQINGAFGIDLSDFTDEKTYVDGFKKMSEGLCKIGVTGFLPTIISQTKENYHSILPLLSTLSSSTSLDSKERQSRSLGYHLEGPFIHPRKSGCHPTSNLITAPKGLHSLVETYGEDSFVRRNEDSLVKMITVAPDVEGILEVIPGLVERGWKVSLGNTNASTEQALQGVANGATLLTHLFNAMPPMHHREPGLIGLLGLAPTSSNGSIVKRPYFSIIADGIHVHPQAVCMAYNAHPDGCILVSDAMHMLDPSLADGVHPWRDQHIEKRNGGITLAGTDTLAGSILPLPQAVLNLSNSGIPLSKAVVCAMYTPAKALGGEVENMIGLSVGCWADLCIWDGKGLKGVWKGGKEVWYEG